MFPKLLFVIHAGLWRHENSRKQKEHVPFLSNLRKMFCIVLCTSCNPYWTPHGVGVHLSLSFSILRCCNKRIYQLRCLWNKIWNEKTPWFYCKLSILHCVTSYFLSADVGWDGPRWGAEVPRQITRVETDGTETSQSGSCLWICWACSEISSCQQYFVEIATVFSI